MEDLKLDPKATALVLIDLQNGILARKMAPYETKTVEKTCVAMAERFRKAGAPIVYVNVDLGNMVKTLNDQPPADPSAAPPPEASELTATCGIQEGDLRVTKRCWTAFGHTDLEKKLRDRGIKTIVLAGVATTFGVESTGRDAQHLGFNVVFAEDAMTSISAESHKFSVGTIFPVLGRVRQSKQIVF